MKSLQLKHSLFPKQLDFVYSNAKYTLYSGAFRGGKTIALGYRTLRLALETPGSRGLVGCHTYTMLHDIIIPTLLDIFSVIPQKFWRFKASPSPQITIENKGKQSIILLRNLEREDKIRGHSLNWYIIDEATVGISRDIYLQLNARLSFEGATGAIATNPGAKSHYLYKAFFVDGVDDPNFAIVKAKTSDNIFLPADYIETLKKQYPEAWISRYLEGEWGTQEGSVFKNFTYENNISEFQANKDWRYFLGIDFGYTNPFAVVLIGLDSDDRVHVVDEIYRRETLVTEMGDRIKEQFVDQYNIEAMICDPADPASKMELERILEIQSMFGINKNKVNVIHKMIKMVEPAGDSRPRLIIHKRCTNVIKEFEAYMWVKTRDGFQAKEEPVKGNDHSIDAIRYVIATLRL